MLAYMSSSRRLGVRLPKCPGASGHDQNWDIGFHCECLDHLLSSAEFAVTIDAGKEYTTMMQM
jgi:hypothetical protein